MLNGIDTVDTYVTVFASFTGLIPEVADTAYRYIKSLRSYVNDFSHGSSLAGFLSVEIRLSPEINLFINLTVVSQVKLSVYLIDHIRISDTVVG